MRVKVGPRTFSVTLMSPDEPDYTTCRGTCSEHWEIELAGNDTPPEMASTLVHELIHAIHFGYDIPDTDEDKEEAMCLAFEGPLLALIVDNPGLCVALRKAVKQGVPLKLKETDE